MVFTATVCFVFETVDLGGPAQLFFIHFESASIYFFTIEFGLRLLACANQLRFLTSALNLIDLCAILPYYISLGLGSESGGLGVMRDSYEVDQGLSRPAPGEV